MSDWDRLVLKEAGYIALCAFLGMLILYFTGGTSYPLWKVICSIIVIMVSVRITLWWVE